MISRPIRVAILIALLFQAQSAICDGFHVSPLKLYFDAKSNTSSLKVMNKGGQKVTLQLEAMSWFQDEEGQDQYTSTEEIIFFPKILAMEADEERIIRVGYQGDPVEKVEKAYRLYIQELPTLNPGEVAAKFVVRMGIPVFIRPADNEFAWNVDVARLVERGLGIRVNNKGNRFFMVSAMKAVGRDTAGEEVFNAEDKGWYVLAGKGRNFVLPVGHEDCRKVTTLEVTVSVNKETQDQQVDVNSSDCATLENAIPNAHRVLPGQ